MLIRTSSGSTSVGHLSHSPHGFSSLHRPDVSFQCGGLVFPVHSVLLSVSSRFWTEFFTYIQGKKAPEVFSLDSVKCDALNAISMGAYLDFIYSGSSLPAFDTVPESVELLRVAAFFGNEALTSQLCGHLAALLPELDEDALLEVFKAAADLKLRRLVADCLPLLLPQFNGWSTSDATVATAIESMDGVLSKTVLTQLAMQGNAEFLSLAPGTPTGSGSSNNGSSGSSSNGSGSNGSGSSGSSCTTTSPCSPTSTVGSPGSPGSSQTSHSEPRAALGTAAAGQGCTQLSTAEGLEHMKRQFVRVLEAKGWGQ